MTAPLQEDFLLLKQASLRRCATQEEFDLVLKAYEFAADTFRDVTRPWGEPFVYHSVQLALIVVNEIGLGCKSICAALLHDVVTNSEYTTEDIQAIFGERITSIVDGLSRIEKLFAGSSNNLTDRFRSMLMTMNDDIRVVIIKLADVLLNLRRKDTMPEKETAKLLNEAMYVFVPMAHRLGLYRIKSEMENAWMQYSQPEEYAAIDNRLKEIMSQRNPFVKARFITPVSEALSQAGFHFNIFGRVKTHYSIWNKMQKRGIDFNNIYDIFAVRVVFFPISTSTETEQCRQIYNIISGLYPEEAKDRFRDWLDEPRETGYQALHATFKCDDRWIEVQIRSKRMDDIAERGLAAHWRYKGQDDHSGMDRWSAQIRESLENKDLDALAFFDSFHAGSLSPEICVFSPKGEPRILPKGATALDFAFHIHSKVGEKALAAKVNQKLCPLPTVLRGGDQVEIITAESVHPKPEWLDFLTTSKARGAVNDVLRTNMTAFRERGKELLTARLAEMGIRPQAKVMRKLTAAWKTTTREELYTKIGQNTSLLQDLEEILRSNSREKDVRYWRLTKPLKKGKEGQKTESVTEFHLAECCHPMPAQKVTARRKGKLWEIHRADCQHLARIKKENLNPMHWESYIAHSRLYHIVLSGKDRIGLVDDLGNNMKSFLNLNFRSFQLTTHDEVFECLITLYAQDTADVEALMQSLLAVSHVHKVFLTENQPS